MLDVQSFHVFKSTCVLFCVLVVFMENHVFVEIAQAHRVPLFHNYSTGHTPSIYP